MVLLSYTTCINVDLAHHEIFRAEVGKGGINIVLRCYLRCFSNFYELEFEIFGLVSKRPGLLNVSISVSYMPKHTLHFL